ncbi:DUF4011 domain-containing protein [Budviciaceae bacterium CWB-B4]|uniref:DUF4011 domain-containing protein n=1 Tax=Limnobaculum xujianqingii TaxID=2738837 RepID=A0A9D7FZU0_9GAMM|nr:AAA domain-containing protein [Limnobaculum xujianqingii]MBK5074687.1 DUF4011 domain-containing protein [Limnobaculum xujianqingii]MBK5177981.1 DUF4011 domain-containing protein [Limnobaculum xujianqingii]
MMRFCPNCHTERALTEIFCEGHIDNHSCGWDLSSEPIHAEGWRPIAIISAEDVAQEAVESIATPSAASHCQNGHLMEEGDLICMQCGADAATATSDNSDVSLSGSGEVADTDSVTCIGNWQVLRRINRNDSIRERYQAQHQQSGQHGVLTLYTYGAEPDPAIYEVIRRLPREHVPEIIETGRWNDRAWQVAEELTGGSLADSATQGDFWQPDEISHIVRELGSALSSFSEHGLRHRDLRPANLLIRTRHPLDIVIIEFGSACLSEFDLDIVSPLEISRYSAPETLAGGVAAASDWWSLGIILLEQVTQGRCFENIHPHAFLIQVLANGITLPESLDANLRLLLRGLLTRDRHQRWQWPEVQAWLDGRPVAVADETLSVSGNQNFGITLNQQHYTQPAIFALAAARHQYWQEALELMQRGAITSWAQQVGLADALLTMLQQVAELTDLDDNYRLMLVLKLLNPNMPLILQGEIVTPSWLLEHPLEGYELLLSPLPDLLGQMESGHWLSQIKIRQIKVRQRGKSLRIAFDEEALRIHLLATSRARLLAIWEEQRKLFPDTTHSGLRTLIDRRNLNEDELILLLSADIGQFTSAESLLVQASTLADRYNIINFDREESRELLTLPRADIYQKLADRLDGFNRSNIADIDSWAERFLLTRRLPLEQVLVMLAIPPEHWMVPEKQRYIHQVLDFFTRKITASTMRGSLVRMSISPHAGRVDLYELGGEKKSSEALLNHLLTRNRQAIPVDSQTLLDNELVSGRLRTLNSQTQLYMRDTGINGMYLGFPFLLINTQPKQMKPRIAPLLLWPVNINMEAGIRGVASLRFDHDRGAVRLNPALENFVGIPSVKRWQEVADQLLSQAALSVEEVMESFSTLVAARENQLVRLPPLDVEVPENASQLVCSAVLFHASFIGQAISEDLRQLSTQSPGGTALETALGLNSDVSAVAQSVSAGECYFTAASDPSQESAVLAARNAPGLLIEGPPGTGKSQTIVNMVADAIGQKRSLLIICQKPAALEVVFKRIMAGGLGDRIVMVKDAQKDRDTIIRNVRAQLETLYKPAETSEVNPWVTSRKKSGRHLDRLEQELDSYYQALYQSDEQTGISYRSLLGELMKLEACPDRLEVPALQLILQRYSLEQIEDIKQAIIPGIALWLEANYEQSPLVQLSPFLSNQATLFDFSARFERFCQAERQRDVILANPHRAFEVTEDSEYRESLANCRASLALLTSTEWENLARWLPLFFAYHGSIVQGEQILAQLEQLSARLQQIDSSGSDQLLFEPLANCDSQLLLQLIAAATTETEKRGFLQALNPFYYLRRGKLRAFLLQTGLQNSHDTVMRLLISARSEQQWRGVRTELNRLHQRLNLPQVGLLDSLELANQLGTTLRDFRRSASLYQPLSVSPDINRLIPAIIEHQQAGFEGECEEITAAINRCQARAASLSALENLRDWLEASASDEFTLAIHQNRPLTYSLEAITAALPSLAAYQQFRPVAAQLDKTCLTVLEILRQQQKILHGFSQSQLELVVARALDREVRLVWKQQMEWRSPILLQEQATINDKIEQLANADSQMRALNRLELTEVIKTNNISPLRAWEEITRLTGKRARRLREFMEQGTARGLMQLRPVWLMTPDVASQVLPLKAGLFDTVIYDEASQMPVEYALPTLFRSRNMVVSGDEKQMPPSTFFSGRGIVDDDADDNEDELEADNSQQEAAAENWNYRQISDCPDLLHLARTVLPVQTLEIHYRSAYRELINFSNYAFYENRLNIPVQHSGKVIDAVKPVSLIMVNGLYQNQSNQQEAEQVAITLAEIWQQPYAQRPSVGVVTFNQKQAQLIQNVLEAKAEQDEGFRLAYYEEQQRLEDDEDMSFFVKNVENVQGDERDVIIFSTTFGRNHQGTFRRNFGILGQQGGERRLNVAITRARKQVMIMSSMPIEEISDLLSTRRQPDIPRDFLQGYLEYARSLSTGEFANGQALLTRMNRTELASRAQTEQHDGFIASVVEYIRSQGWLIADSRQEGAFYFDCIIEDPLTGRYLLGIECDMPRHGLLQHARARELWRPLVLKRVAPYRHRISIQNWYNNGPKEQARLKQAILQAINAEQPEVAAITSENISEENP